jgi:polyvinyl alcohol dehydrogenase (cytochrome)
VDAVTGKTRWKTYVIAQTPAAVRANSQGTQQFAPAGAAVWNTPTIDRKRHAVYVGTGDATTFPAADTSDAVMALDMATGKVLWSYQAHKKDSYLVGCAGPAANKTDNCPQVVGPDWDIPGSVILREVAGRRLLLAGTKPGDILALDPDRGGALVWRKNVSGGALAGDGPGYPSGARKGVQWGGAADDKTLYYGLTDGGLVAIGLNDGERRWFAPLNRGTLAKADNSAAVTALTQAVFVGGTDGTLFAVSTEDHSILWSFNTARQFETVNHVAAKGGSISAPGATVANGMVFVGSGYSTTNGEPGNVLLAFAPEHGSDE